MNKFKTIFLILILVLLFCSPLFYANEIFANNNTKIQLSLLPRTNIFNVNKMAPGDEVSSNLIIKNSNEKSAINYFISVYKQSGSDKLFNQLIITIKDKEEIIFKDNLKSLKLFKAGKLKNNREQLLKISVTLPIETDNSFQGDTVQLGFVFNGMYPMNDIDEILTGGLPATGEDNPSFLYFIGSILVTSGLSLLMIKSIYNNTSIFKIKR